MASLFEETPDLLFSFFGMKKYRNGAWSSPAQRDFVLGSVRPKIQELVDAGFTKEDFWEEMQEMHPPVVKVPYGAVVFVCEQSHPAETKRDGQYIQTDSTYTVCDYNGVVAMYKIVKRDESITKVTEMFVREDIDFHSIIEEFALLDEARDDALKNADVPYNKRAAVTGIVKSAKIKDGMYPAWKMRVEMSSGWIAFGTVPNAMIDQLAKHEFYDPRMMVGMRVKFTAMFTPSKIDPLFMFFERPTNGEIFESSLALKLLKER